MLLYGFALIYAATGELSYAGIGAKAAAAFAVNPMLIMAGSAMVLAGIGFKLSLAPFHMWTPDVYQGAPTPVTGFLATVSKGAVFIALSRFYMDGALYQYSGLNTALVVLAVASMLVGNWLALRQENIKRLLAYSSIAHFGYLLVVLIALAHLDAGLISQSITFYLTAYTVTTLTAFAVVSTVAGEDPAKQDISAFEGLFWHRPLEASALTVAMLSLAGIPLTAGFMAKFFVITVGIQSDLWGLLAVLVVGSAVGIYYYLRVIFAMSKSTEGDGQSANHLEKLLVLALLASILVLGSWPQPFIAYVGGL
jgi:NADH-quinone oxidoreductase subunit N